MLPLAEPATFEAKGEDANAALRPLVDTSLGEEAVSDEDLLNAADLVQVRQDEGVQFGAEEPDWELIEKLEEIRKRRDRPARRARSTRFGCGGFAAFGGRFIRCRI